MKHTLLILTLFFVFAPLAHSETAGKATYYTVKSCLSEGTSGVYTASGELYDETALTAALRHRDFGGLYRVTNMKNGRSIIVKHTDYGPGKGPTKRGVVIDLTPAAFDQLGGARGITKNGVAWGEIDVIVEEI